MRRHAALWFALLLVASVAGAAGKSSDNTIFRSFGIDVTNTAQGFYIANLIAPTPPGPIQTPPAMPSPPGPTPASNCNAWLLENDDDVDDIWIVYSVEGQPGALPIAVADAADSVTPNHYNQMRLKHGQAKSLQAFSNTYISVIGTGNAHLHAEQTCGGIH